MSIITAILEVDDDGTLHLPLPLGFGHGKVEVTATLRAVSESSGVAVVSPEQVIRRRAALLELRKLGGLQTVIPDPVEWQHEQREDRTLPGQG
jgi:hypothetical protein